MMFVTQLPPSFGQGGLCLGSGLDESGVSLVSFLASLARLSAHALVRGSDFDDDDALLFPGLSELAVLLFSVVVGTVPLSLSV